MAMITSGPMQRFQRNFILLGLAFVCQLCADVALGATTSVPFIARTCLDHFTRRSTPLPNGLYPITVASTALNVTCDMTRHGGGWTEVFHHDVSNNNTRTFAERLQIDANANNTNATLYSIMSFLPALKEPNGPYEFMMEWPNSKYAAKQQVWRQFAIGNGSNIIQNYFPIDVPNPINFIGIQEAPQFHQGKTAYTCMARSNGWGFALMQRKAYIGMLWGPILTPLSFAALWMRPVTCHPSCKTCKGPSLSDCLSCIDTSLQIVNGACGWRQELAGMTTTTGLQIDKLILITGIRPTCEDIQIDGLAASNGQYRIVTRSGYDLPVICDFTSFGGRWTRIFNHNMTVLKELAFEGQENANYLQPNASLYSIMSFLPEFTKNGSQFEFMFEWPESDFTEKMVWGQSEIPSSSSLPPSIEPINIPYPDSFVGIQRSSYRQTTFECSDSSWAFAIMQRNTYQSFLYGPPGPPVRIASLWVRSPLCHVSCSTCSGRAAAQCLSCAIGLEFNGGLCVKRPTSVSTASLVTSSQAPLTASTREPSTTTEGTFTSSPTLPISFSSISVDSNSPTSLSAQSTPSESESGSTPEPPTTTAGVFASTTDATSVDSPTSLSAQFTSSESGSGSIEDTPSTRAPSSTSPAFSTVVSTTQDANTQSVVSTTQSSNITTQIAPTTPANSSNMILNFAASSASKAALSTSEKIALIVTVCGFIGIVALVLLVMRWRRSNEGTYILDDKNEEIIDVDEEAHFTNDQFGTLHTPQSSFNIAFSPTLFTRERRPAEPIEGDSPVGSPRDPLSSPSPSPQTPVPSASPFTAETPLMFTHLTQVAALESTSF